MKSVARASLALLGAFALALAGCDRPASGRVASGATATAAVAPSPPSPNSAALSPAHGPALMQQCSRDTPTGVTAYWAVPDTVRGVLDAALARRPSAIRIDNPTAFFRQYVGIVQNGHRRIYVNAFPRPDQLGLPPQSFPKPNYWYDEPSVVCDGGAIFWGAVFDPATGTFSEFETNGPDVIQGPHR